VDRPPLRLVPADRLRPHEEVSAAAVAALARTLSSEGFVRRAIVADETTLVVLDGHHRLHALRSLGCRRVPVLLVDYLRSPIELSTWRKNERAPTKEEVLEHGLKAALYPEKTTRHRFPWKLEEERVPLSDLLAP